MLPSDCSLQEGNSIASMHNKAAAPTHFEGTLLCRATNTVAGQYIKNTKTKHA